ncbi:CDP-diacylglycerol--glycerol-3-phosphate 3-phosphatidyltransferase [Zavarzinia aquatilis]|uniref:CDP-diacylglycerol--glycerol-3-phosphate 3-phosphatidyltransferase n=1 Tax=Zavarzinia aquatilis TaxID=2211142 RepID=A0A317DV21_9PROT|nr:CDP-diacylglycerol--glycerol-3-phosphate 3-phosphatidyltransferase [Zavarzinia aquatilis]PWR18528.1 CDP-diacylglycerol--glycerol-3-phosphate 3-phosphatidyltransferase [Zavarzinia aquatilis]
MITNLPNLLTLFRIVVIPLMVAAFFLDFPVANWVSFSLYTAACITDYFDGWLARALNQTSPLGRFLDPIADKLLVAAALLMLVAKGHIADFAVIAAVIILLREVLVSGLREFLAELRVGVPVSKLAKWKTTVQMIALGFLMVGRASPAAIPSEDIGLWGLWGAAALTLVTGYDYLRAGLRHMTGTAA